MPIHGDQSLGESQGINAAQEVNEFESGVKESLDATPQEDFSVDFDTKEITDAQFKEAESHGVRDIDLLDTSTDVNQEIEANQEWYESAYRAVEGGIAKGTMTFLENVGYLADIPQWFGYTNSFEEGYTNMLSEWASEKKKEYDEYNPIYGDSAWAQSMRGLQGLVDSTVGFAGIGAGAGQVIGRGTALLNSMVKAGHITEAAIARIGTAAATNYAESTMMAAELHENVMNDALRNGLDNAEALRIADRESKDFIRQNKINIATDMFTLRSMAKGQGILSGAMDKSKREILKAGVMDAAGEAFEEVSAGFLQKENERDGSLEIGSIVEDDSSYIGRAAEYATSEEGITEGIMGAIGGPFQHMTVKAFNKGIEAGKKKFGLIDPVNDPGEFTEERPEFTETPSEPVGRKPLDPVERYVKINANTSKEEAEKYVTEEDWENYRKEVQEWARGSMSDAEYEKSKEKHEKEVELYEQRKSAHELEKKKYEEYVYQKKMGGRDQAKKDVEEFLKNDHELRKKYNKAVLDGDQAAIADIENQRFEGLFLRYAQRGMTEGLEEQLNEIRDNSESTDEQRKFAEKHLKKMDEYKAQYMKEFNKHGRQKGEELFRLRSRVESTKEALSDIDKQVDEAGMKLAQEMKDVEGKMVNPLQTERMSLNSLKGALEHIENKLSLNDNAVIESELSKKKADIEKRIAEIDKEFTTGKLSDSEIKALDGYEEFEAQSKKKADAWLTYLGYKKSYDYQSSPAFEKDLQKKNYEYLNDQIVNNTFNDQDVAVNMAMITHLNLSNKQKKEILKELDKVASNIENEEIETAAEYEDLQRRKKQYDAMYEEVTQSSLDALSEVIRRQKNKFTKEDEVIEAARRNYHSAQQKVHTTLDPKFQNANVESLRQQYQEATDKAWEEYQASKKAKEQAIKDNTQRIHDLKKQMEANKQQRKRIVSLRNTVDSRLEANDKFIGNNAMEFEADRYLNKLNETLSNETTPPPSPMSQPEPSAPTRGIGAVVGGTSKKKTPPSTVVQDVEENKGENTVQQVESKPKSKNTRGVRAPHPYIDKLNQARQPKGQDGVTPPPLTEADAPRDQGPAPTFQEAPSPMSFDGVTPPDYSEADSPTPPLPENATPEQLQAAAQAMRDMKDEDSEALASSLSHMSSAEVSTKGKELGEIVPTDFDNSDVIPPVSPAFNEHESRLNSEWEWSFSYQSTSDGIGDENDSGLVDWLETTTDLDKRGYTVRYEIDKGDLSFDFKGSKAALTKYLNGETLTDAELAELPIRTVVYKADGTKLIHGGKEVYGWLKRSSYNFIDNNGEKGESLLKARRDIVNIAKDGGYFESKIRKVGSGKLKSEPTRREDPRQFLDKVKLLVSDGPTLIDQDKSIDDDFGSVGNRGFVFLKTVDANGRPFPLKMNSRRLDPDEVKTILNVLVNYSRDDDHNSPAITEHVSGLTNGELMSLLVYEGKASLLNEYPLNADLKAGTLTFGKKTIPLSKVEENAQEVSEYLATMWRTTNVRMLNSKMDKTFGKDFTWFGQDISVSDMNYNDFLFNDEALSTNASFPNGRLFINPHVITNKAEEWNKVMPKKMYNEKDVAVVRREAAKLGYEAEMVGELYQLTHPTENKTIKTKMVVKSFLNQKAKEKGITLDFSQGKVDTKEVTPPIVDEKSSTTIFDQGPDPLDSVFGEEKPDWRDLGGDPDSSQSPGVQTNVNMDMFRSNSNKATGKDSADESNKDGKTKRVRKRKKDGGNKPDNFDTKGPDAPKYSEITIARRQVNVEKEIKTLRKMLPNVPVNIINGLINVPRGGVAEGKFYNGVVSISDMGNEGVAFHEGFHAVLDGYLSYEERKELFNEARNRFGKNESDLQVEELLAEEFREYMLSRGELKVPSMFKKLYNMLMDIVDLFRSNKSNKVFSRIRRGRFDYTPNFSRSKQVLYSELNGVPSQAMVRDAVSTIAYRVVSFSGVRSMDDTAKAYDNLESVFNDVYNSLLDDADRAEEAGQDEIVENIDIITHEDFDNWDKIVQLTMDELSAYDLTERKDDTDVSEENEEISGELNIKPALLYSGKDNASNNTKLMVAMLREPGAKSQFFGPGFEKLANFATSWRLLEDNLAGIVTTQSKTEMEGMLEALEGLAAKHPEFNELLSQLKADESVVPQYKKTQFYKAFSKQSVLYNNAIVTISGKDYTWKIGNADGQSHAKLLRAEWNEDFKNQFTYGDQVVKKKALRNTLDRFKKLRQHTTNDISAKQRLDPRSYRILSDIFSDLGMDISPESFKLFVSSQKGRTEQQKFYTALEKSITPTLLNTPKNPSTPLEAMLNDGYKYDGENNFITDYSQFNQLALNEGFTKKETLENMVMGPDGNLYWTKSLNNSITKTVSLWKQDPSEMNGLWQSQYHKKSRWLNRFMGSDLDESVYSEGDLTKKTRERLEQFSVEVFLSNRVDDGEDTGTSYTDLNKIDAPIDSINRTLNGVKNKSGLGSVFSPLTLADKSSFYMFSGIPVEKFNISKNGYGNATNVMLEYFLAEAERIAVNVDNDVNVDYYDGASKKMFWFPELSIGTPLAKKLNMYTKDGRVKLDSNEVMNAVKEHISDSIIKRTAEFGQEMRERGIIVKNDKGVEIFNGIDSGIMNYYENNTVVESKMTPIDELLTDYVVNSMISNIEFTMLFAGDPAFYKDLSKRTPSTIATGDDLMHVEGQPKTFNVAVVSDISHDSSLYKDYLAAFEKAGVKNPKTVLKSYLGMDLADAQAYITPERFKSLMIMSGKWEPKHDAVFERLQNGEDVNPEDLLVMQPLKGQHHELRSGIDQIKVPTYLKYSQAVLWDSLVKGTKNEKVLKQMRENEVDELVFKSGIKVGAMDVSDIESVYNGEGSFTPFTLTNANWKLQQDLPAKYEKKEKALLGSQVRKNIKANIQDRAFLVGGKEIDGSKLAEMIDDVEVELSDLGKKEFNKKYGVVDGKITNIEPIYRHLEDKFKKDRVDNNVLGQLEAKVDLDLIFQYKEKIEQELFAELNKATVKLTSPGGSFIQISGAGFTGLKKFDAGQINRNGIIPLQDIDSFQGPRKGKDGTIAADVMIPFKAVRNIPGWEKMSSDQLKDALGDTVQNLIGYRIPNQGMSSIDLLNVVGILPPSAGDSMVVYDEITGKTGSDFDIDKMYVMMHHTAWNKNTKKLERITDENLNHFPGVKKDYASFQKKALENKRMELWGAVLSSPDTFIDLVTPLDSEWFKNDAYYVSLLGNPEDHDEFLEFSGVPSMESYIEQSNTSKYEMAAKFYKNKKGSSLEFASPLTQLLIKEQNTAGNAGVGQTANHLAHHILLQQVGEAMTLNQNGDKITEVISAWLNAYVDNAKEPYISLINNNTFTANTVFYMLRQGYDPKFVNRLMSQPIIKEYVGNHFNSESKLVKPTWRKQKYTSYSFKVDDTENISYKENKASVIIKPKHGQTGIVNAFDKTILDRGYSISKKPMHLNLSALNEYTVEDLEKSLLSENENDQIGLLLMFEGIRQNAKQFNDMVRASKFDTDGAGSSNVENFTTRMLVDKVINENKNAQAYEKIIKDTFVGGMMKNSHRTANDIFGDLFMSGSKAAVNNLTVINSMIGGDGTNLDVNSKIVKDFYSYVYSGAMGDSNITNMFYGNKSMAHKVRMFKDKYPSNKLLSKLRTILNTKEGPSFVTFPSSKKKDRSEIDDLWLSWEELLTDETSFTNKAGETYTTKQFAEDLVKYAFAASGFNKNINSFFDLIPHTYMRGDLGSGPSFNGIMNSIKKDLNKHAMQSSFIDQFFRHNWMNKDIVPSYSSENNDMFRTISSKYPKTHGFRIDADKTPSSMMVKNIEGDLDPKQYVRLNFKKGAKNLYKYAGRKGDDLYFERVTPLGMSEKGNVIKEYSYDNQVGESHVNTSHSFDTSKMKSELKLDTQAVYYGVNFGVANTVNIGEETSEGFKVRDTQYLDNEFVVEEYTNNRGEAKYKVVSYTNRGTENEKSRTVVREFDTKEEALASAKGVVGSMTKVDLLLALSSEC